MTNQHPLTDEICREIDKANHHSWDEFKLMRAAADWQLDQVVHFLEVNKDLSIDTVLRFIRPALRSNQSDTPWLDITYDGFNND